MNKADIFFLAALLAGISALNLTRPPSETTPLVSLSSAAAPRGAATAELAVDLPLTPKGEFRLAELALGMGQNDVLTLKGKPQNESKSESGLQTLVQCSWSDQKQRLHLSATFLNGFLINIQPFKPEPLHKARKEMPGYGASKSEVLNALGQSDREGPNSLHYRNQPGTLSFIFKDDTVESITLSIPLKSIKSAGTGNR